MLLLLTVLTALLGLAPSEAKLAKGHTDTDSWNYISSFAFDKVESKATGEVSGSVFVRLQHVEENKNHDVQLLLYVDEKPECDAVNKREVPDCKTYDNFRKDVYKNKKLTCEDRVNMAKRAVNVTFDSARTGYASWNVVQSVKTRFWYVALADCAEGGMPKLDYRATFLQHTRGRWSEEFSMNELGLNTLFVVFFSLFLVVTFGELRRRAALQETTGLTELDKFFGASVFLFLGYLLFKMIHWTGYATNGVGVPFFSAVGSLMLFGSQLLFFVMLMAMAQGSVEDALNGKNKIVLGAFCVLYASAFIWSLAGADEAAHSYLFDGSSAAGILLILSTCAMGVWFAFENFQSWQRANDSFHVQMFFFLGWFAIIPLAGIVGSATTPTLREKTVQTMTVLMQFVFFLATMALFLKGDAQAKVCGSSAVHHGASLDAADLSVDPSAGVPVTTASPYREL
ncbi:MAG: hypothetical protein MHM6MM_005119 [Cercozoa sp. M6MM]